MWIDDDPVDEHFKASERARTGTNTIRIGRKKRTCKMGGILICGFDIGFRKWSETIIVNTFKVTRKVNSETTLAKSTPHLRIDQLACGILNGITWHIER